MHIEENIPLAPFTAFRIGGRARFFARVRTQDELKDALAFAREKNLPFFILGGGSNILISDEGFPGVIVQMDMKGIAHEANGNDILVHAAAGENWDDFVLHTVANDWQGVENLSGVPGTVGGAPVQNIGCYGSEAADTIESVTAVDTQSGAVRKFSKEECRFSYRKSRFNSDEKGRYIVTGVMFRLKPHGDPVVKYENVISYFKDLGRKPTLREVRSAILEIRSGKGTLAGKYRNAGSFFKNVVVSEDVLKEIRAIVSREKDAIPGTCCLDPWHWDQGGGKYKVAAACLVHCSGFVPGIREGEVGTSPKQTLAVTNFGNATGGDVLAFARKIQETVQKKFGVSLEIEPELVGF